MEPFKEENLDISLFEKKKSVFKSGGSLSFSLLSCISKCEKEKKLY
jgi:hypothetical protein